MAKVVTMGEIMLRLSTPNNEKYIQADEFDINYAAVRLTLRYHLQTMDMMQSLLQRFRITRSVHAQLLL